MVWKLYYSACLLQNQTLTTSFSSCKLSARALISWADGFGLLLKCCSRAPLIDTSMLVRFLRFRPWAAILSMLAEVPVVLSASANHFCNNGLSLHMFLKDSWSASNRQMVVWLNTLPYRVPRASPTSACVNPSLMRRCLNCFAKASKSSEKPMAESCSEYRENKRVFYTKFWQIFLNSFKL